MDKVTQIIQEELTELARRNRDLYWGRDDKKRKKAYGTEREMNDETYRLRREVMNYIYYAKNLIKKVLNYDLPRQRIRIIDVIPNRFVGGEEKFLTNFLLGCATMGGNDIWIPAKTIESKYDLKYVVFHELLHSAFCVDHDSNSPLMNPEYRQMTSDEMDNWLIKHIKESGKVND